jgi:ketosteroid isomerase-like protein
MATRSGSQHHRRELSRSRGRPAVAEDMQEAWEYFHPEPIDFLDAGEHVVVDSRWKGRGRASGVEVERKTTQVWTLRQGKVVRFETFTERALALEAVGLRE